MPKSFETPHNKPPSTLIPQMDERQFMEIERTDVDFGAFKAASGASASLVSTAMGNPPSHNSNNQAQGQVDPIEFVKNLISAGFTPTRSQLSNVTSNFGGPSDSTNTWFAIFLQRLLKQNKNKKRK